MCARCGYENLPGYAICAGCGRPLVAAGGPIPAAPAPPRAMPALALPTWSPPPRAEFPTLVSGFFAAWGKDALQYFAVYLVVGLLVQGALALVALVIPTALPAAFTPGTPTYGSALLATLVRDLVVSTSVSFLISLIATSFVAGGVTEFAIRRRNGDSVRMTDSLRRGLSRFPSVLGAGLVYGFLTTGLILLNLVVLFAGILALPSPAAIALLCGGSLLGLVGSVAAIYLGIALLLYVPPIMIEGSPAIGALRRSWGLTKYHRLSLFGAMLIVGLLASAVSLVATIPAQYALGPLPVRLAAALATALTGSWTMVLAAVAYDLILKESGFVPRARTPSSAALTPRA